MGEGSAPPVGQISSVVLKRVADDDLALPALPWVLRAAAHALSESPFSPAKVAAALEPDPLTVARLIRKANGSAYSDGSAVITPLAAATRLGARLVRIFLDDSGCDRHIESRSAEINVARRRVWEHCVAVGLVAKDLAGFVFGMGHGEIPEAAYTGGLLHDLGKPIIAALLLDAEKRLMATGLNRWLDVRAWEHVISGSHATVGRLLAVKWGMPTVIRRCIAEPYVYDPWKPYAISNFVTLANSLVERIGLDVAPPADQNAMELALFEGPRLMGFDDSNLDWASRDMSTRVAAHIGPWAQAA